MGSIWGYIATYGIRLPKFEKIFKFFRYPLPAAAAAAGFGAVPGRA